jgi:hypothetical protein
LILELRPCSMPRTRHHRGCGPAGTGCGGCGLRSLCRLDAGLSRGRPGTRPGRTREGRARWATDDLATAPDRAARHGSRSPSAASRTRIEWRRPGTASTRAPSFFLELAARAPDSYLVLNARQSRKRSLHKFSTGSGRCWRGAGLSALLARWLHDCCGGDGVWAELIGQELAVDTPGAPYRATRTR